MNASFNKYQNWINRRTFLTSTGVGLGAMAFGQIANAQQSNEQLGLPHHIAKAKRVIFLCMAGGPSHLETFDYKPELERMNGEPMPESFTQGQPIAQLQGQKLKCQGPARQVCPVWQEWQLLQRFFAVAIQAGR